MSGHTPHTPNQKIALLIAVLAATLAFSEILGKNAQTKAINQNIEASNYWNFFQAKTIRKTTVQTNLQLLEAIAALNRNGEAADNKIKETIASLQGDVERYESEPDTKEGRKELAERAKKAEAMSDRSLVAYHTFEYAAACLEIAIVLTSAAIVTEIMLLLWLACGMGVVGAGLCFVGALFPTLLHL
jgi:hypothetical protein